MTEREKLLAANGNAAGLDVMTDRELRVRAIELIEPAIKLDGASDEYVKGRFDALDAEGCFDRSRRDHDPFGRGAVDRSSHDPFKTRGR